MKTYFIAILVIMGTLFSCKKEVSYATQATASEIEITFNSPLHSDNAEVGIELNVEGIIDANELMGGWSILITNASGESIKYYEDIYEQTQYIFHYHWIPAEIDTGHVTITISALDKNKNVLNSKSVLVLCE